MFRYLAVLVILLCLGVTGLLYKTQNNVLILYGLLEGRTHTEGVGSKWLNILPKHLAIWKAKATEHDCTADYKGTKVSHVSMLTDVVFNQFAEPGVELDKEKAKELISYFTGRGCSINEIHPGSGFAPIHSAFLAAPDDHEYVFEIIRLGGDMGIRIQKPSSSVHGKTARELISFIVQKGKTPDIEKYKMLLRELDDRGIK